MRHVSFHAFTKLLAAAGAATTSTNVRASAKGRAWTLSDVFLLHGVHLQHFCTD
jgi:hypothetical protein